MRSLSISTLQLFGPACLVYLLSDVRPTVELGDSLNQSGRRELSLPSSHTTVRTGPYTAVHDYCDLASTIFFIGIYPIASMTPFDMALCMP